ncbi:hypothetical protein IWW55_001148 [Coemansia sp. RSA 2706]|nr:hypothetical protein IWW55_001148 [Coemansia sp. RSA 2706]KAJ2314355.1 hypothetical protein IWW54_000970 [Coemansia sp. RSA 2705]KAJ2726104.1 hypothetical protein H4R23_004069 [Coemansia sp. Cherry 401B]
MRKSTSLKFGLNVRKPAANPAPQGSSQARKSVFSGFPADDLDTSEQPPQQKPQPYSGGSLAQQSAKLATELESANPSVYAYDDVYDTISNARIRAKQAQKTDDQRPRYMEKLLETAKQRQMQSEVVKERLLEKEREREGSMYADKETFVTASYKEHKEQRQKLVEEEEAREVAEQKTGRRAKLDTAATGFYRELLNQIDRDDVSKATDMAAQLETAPPAEEAADTNLVLGSGLNVVSSSVHRRHKQSAAAPPSALQESNSLKDQQPTSRQNHHPGTWRNRSIRNELDEQEQLKQAQQDNERQLLIQRYARRNTHADIAAARQRYLERKAN